MISVRNELIAYARACTDGTDVLTLLRSLAPGFDERDAAAFLNLSTPQRRMAAGRLWAIEKYFERRLKGREAAALLDMSYAYFQVLAYGWRKHRDLTKLVPFASTQVRKSRTPEKRLTIEAAMKRVFERGDVVKPTTVYAEAVSADPAIGQPYVTQVFSKILLDLPSGIPLLPRRYWSAGTERAFGSVIVIDQIKINRWLKPDVTETPIHLIVVLDAHTRIILGAQLASGTPVDAPLPSDFRSALKSSARPAHYFGPASANPPLIITQVDNAASWNEFFDALDQADIPRTARRIPGLNTGALARRLLGDKLGILTFGNRPRSLSMPIAGVAEAENQISMIMADHNLRRLERHPEISDSNNWADAPLYLKLSSLL